MTTIAAKADQVPEHEEGSVTTRAIAAIFLHADAANPTGEPSATIRAPSCRRIHYRVAGPFDGRPAGALETPVKLFDLSCGGAFINSMHEQREGVTLALTIDVPHAGRISLKAKTLYSRWGFGFAVRFVDVMPDTATRLDRALRALQGRAPFEE